MNAMLVIAAFAGGSIEVLLAIAAALAALGFMLFRVVVPTARGITTFNDDVVPHLKYLPLLADLKPVLSTLTAIAGEFASDSGSTLKDAMDRLEHETAENRLVADEFARANRAHIAALEIAMGTVKELAAEDRLLARSDRDLARDAYAKMVALVESALRTEQSGARIEAARAVVADDLAATQQRADDVRPGEPPGAAADAASQSPGE